MKKGIKTAKLILTFFMLWCILSGSINAYAATTYNCNKGVHRYSVVIVKNPTEKENGQRQYTCDLCGKTYKTDIPKTGHTWGKWIVDKKATCSETGHEYRVCKNDSSHKETKKLPKTNHKYKSSVTTKPTCTKNGVMTYTCAVCSKQYTKSIPPTGHAWGEWIVDKKAGITVNGEEHRVCKTDPSHTEKRVIKGSIRNINAVDMALTATGFSVFWIFAVLIASDIVILIWFKRRKKKQLNKMTGDKE